MKHTKHWLVRINSEGQEIEIYVRGENDEECLRNAHDLVKSVAKYSDNVGLSDMETVCEIWYENE